MTIYGRTCECKDKGCREHPRVSNCVRPGTLLLYRIDMDDQTGTLMCEACADDACQTGLFHVEEAAVVRATRKVRQ